jgi:hypothetical protein
MNKQLTLAITATITLATAAQAQQQQENPNRFKFSGSSYKLEQTPSPRSAYNNPLPSTVHAGAVPHGLSGIDPGFLAKPTIVYRAAPVAAPAAQTMTNASTSFGTPLNPNPITASIPPQYKASFGKPISPPMVASLPTPAIPNRPAPVNHHAAPTHLSRSSNLHGVIHPHVAAGNAARPAQGLPIIASYEHNQGYTVGPLLPHIGSGGSSSSAQVSGRLMSRH